MLKSILFIMSVDSIFRHMFFHRSISKANKLTNKKRPEKATGLKRAPVGTERTLWFPWGESKPPYPSLSLYNLRVSELLLSKFSVPRKLPV